MDWKIFEMAGKYAGLAGIALIVLLYIFRLILKLDIFKNVGSKGTLLTINNIINKVFFVTIAALVAWLAVALFGNPSQQTPDPPEIIATIPAQSVQVSDLPAEFLTPVQAESDADLTLKLKHRNSLTFNGSTLTIGAPGEGRTVTIACNTLRMTNGARIITNGNNLVILCVNTQFGDNAGISSFSTQTLNAAPASVGAAGGKVRIDSLQSFGGALRVFLPGQNGGDGTTGAPGSTGAGGVRGSDSVQGMLDCRSGGQNGSPGAQGGKGGVGGTGGNGGDGGELILEGVAAKNGDRVYFEAPGGKGGGSGSGGPGGSGGTGGQGGSGGGSCSGGRAAGPGPAGPQGDSGQSGASGQPGKRTP